MSTTCEICCSRRANHACTCGFETCRACRRRYALECKQGECPSCRRLWDVGELRLRLGVTFWSGPYRKMRRAHLLERERPRLLETTEVASREQQRRHLRREMRRLTAAIREGQYHLWVDLRDAQLSYHRLMRLQRSQAAPQGVRARCAHDGCGGIAVDGTCVVCQKQTCLRCGDVREEGHRCDANSVRSMEAIARDCRPCVRCSAPSMRTEGCSVMWCPHCHAFWHWDTRRAIDTRHGTPHNPDHHTWMVTGHGMRPPREIDDIPCGGLPDGAAMHHAFMREFSRTLTVSPRAAVLVAAGEAIDAAQRMRHDYPLAWNEERANEPLRIAFLNGDCDEEAFATALERMERTHLFKRDVGRVLETLVMAGADVLQRFCAFEDCDTTAWHLEALRRIVNQAMLDVCRTHARTAPYLTHDWRWVRPYARH